MIRAHLIKHIYLVTALLLACMPLSLSAQSSQVLSVTPTLFQLSVAPGDVWQSTVKVVNGNPYEMTVYAEVVNFAPLGEEGQGRFIPATHDDDIKSTLAEWIDISNAPIVIPPEQSKEVAFFVDIPDDAPPGGHFAAILVGTQPSTGNDENIAVETTQAVTSLFFLRIDGDIVELGDIREFSMGKSFVETPSADFLLRFENKGNVHLQPRGDIVITNMWGKERGVIPINQKSHFGNVLPESIREFNFSWRGENSVTEIGRFKAVVTLAYGEDGIKSTSAITYFWVVPIKATLITLASILMFGFFVAWMIRLYIRRMLTLAGVDVATKEYVGANRIIHEKSDVRLTSYKAVYAPIQSGALDLKNRLQHAHRVPEMLSTVLSFVRQYKYFFITILVVAISSVGGALYITDASKDQKSYEITIEEDGEETIVDSEEILKDKLDTSNSFYTSSDQHFNLTLYNASGEAGRAAEMALYLEENGYSIDALDTFPSLREKSVILYDDSLGTEAEALSAMLGGILLSARTTDEGGEFKIEVIIGSDRNE